MKVSPPTSERELMERARAIAGLSLGELGGRLGSPAPRDARRAKGWAGNLLEAALGATASSRPVPDFERIGVELKTVPVDGGGRPRESTYVCTVPLAGEGGVSWERSNVRRKLARVLWVPLAGATGRPLAARRVGTALLWSPSPEEEAGLRADWEELMDKICLGRLEQLSAHDGTWLQVRPKAAHSRVRRRGVDASGAPAPVLPCGFYLRSAFTAELLRRHYLMPERYS